MKSKLFFVIFIFLFVILMIVFYIKMDKAIDQTANAQCIFFQLTDIIDCYDLRELCTNENCTYYFDQRINLSYEALKKCEDYLK
jgi:hypothetical protein